MEALKSRNDRLKQLQALCEAIRLRSFSRAAKAVGSSQSAVSTQVRALEEEFGVALFRRQGAGIAPTRFGRDLDRVAHPLVQGLLRLPEVFEEHHRGVSVDTLRIGAGEVSGGLVLPRLVKKFRDRHPQARLEVRVGSGRQRLAWLRGFELDVVATAMDVVPDDIQFHPMVQSAPVLVTPRGHELAERASINIRAIGRHRMVASPAGSLLRHFQDVVMQLHDAHPRIVAEFENWSSMLNSVAAGVGIAIVPDLCVRRRLQVHVVPIEQSYGFRTYGLATRTKGMMTLTASRFIQLAMSGVSDAHEAP